MTGSAPTDSAWRGGPCGRAAALLRCIYLAFNAGRGSAHGCGVAMSTDTALALGLLAQLGRNVPDWVRVFPLTVFVVDDLAAPLVIAFADRSTSIGPHPDAKANAVVLAVHPVPGLFNRCTQTAGRPRHGTVTVQDGIVKDSWLAVTFCDDAQSRKGNCRA